jgi:hypothetical protein
MATTNKCLTQNNKSRQTRMTRRGSSERPPFENVQSEQIEEGRMNMGLTYKFRSLGELASYLRARATDMKEDPPSKRKGDRRFQDGYLHAHFMLADMLDHTMIEEAKSPEERQEATEEAEHEHSERPDHRHARAAVPR